MRTGLGLFALGVLGLLILLALQRGAADLYAFGARYGLDRAGFASAEARDRAQRGLEHAIALDSANPDHQEYLARLEESKGEYHRALERYRMTARARPGWPRAWGDIARLKVRLGELDGELDKAIVNAARLGPWEPGVQLVIAGVAMESAHRLAPETRRAAFKLMSNALKRQERQIVQLAERRGRLDLLCSIPGIAAHMGAARRCI